MRSNADLQKILDAAMEGPAGEDEQLDPARDLLLWLLGREGLVPGHATLDEFITEFIIDPYR